MTGILSIALGVLGYFMWRRSTPARVPATHFLKVVGGVTAFLIVYIIIASAAAPSPYAPNTGTLLLTTLFSAFLFGLLQLVKLIEHQAVLPAWLTRPISLVDIVLAVAMLGSLALMALGA